MQEDRSPNVNAIIAMRSIQPNARRGDYSS